LEVVQEELGRSGIRDFHSRGGRTHASEGGGGVGDHCF
jgi:hypothetical protein